MEQRHAETEIRRVGMTPFLVSLLSWIIGVTYSKRDVRTQDDKDTIGILRATEAGNNVDIDDLVFIPSSR